MGPIEWWITLALGAGDQSSRPVSPVRLTSPSFARRQCWFNKIYNVMGALHGCHAVKFDSCNNLQSAVHTIFVIILRSVSLKIKRNYQ